jgi:hypothetical protein
MVATPHGAIFYSEATLEVRADGRNVRVEVKSGKARLEPAEGVRLEGAADVAAGKKTRLAGSPPPLGRLVQACEAASKTAEQSASRLLRRDPGPDQTLGELARAQVAARKRARSLCAVAASAAALEENEAERRAALVRIEDADRGWRTLSHPDEPDEPK